MHPETQQRRPVRGRRCDHISNLLGTSKLVGIAPAFKGDVAILHLIGVRDDDNCLFLAL